MFTFIFISFLICLYKNKLLSLNLIDLIMKKKKEDNGYEKEGRFYSPADVEKVFDSIIREIEYGCSVREILRREETPSQRTFFKWLNLDDSKVVRYNQAMKLRAHNLFEEILEIADSQDKDVYIDKDGNERTDHNVVNRSKLQVDARKWVIGRMDPAKYGDKMDITTNQKDLNRPILTIDPLSDIDDDTK